MDVKTTLYFDKVRPLKHPEITQAMVEAALENRLEERLQENDFRQVYCRAENGKVMRVILLADGETLENAFYDRNYDKNHKGA
ncbi:MAG: hypothetical protein LDLANPLL_02046 [Turneriella sp.]|nr:hypothetical protein [Turneriella sp.]